MRINRYQIQTGKLPLWPIFLTGVVAGILTMNLGKSILLENTGLLDEYTLYHMKYMTVDSSALFYYVLRLRLKSFGVLAILATTYLGLAVCAGTTFWYGMSAGAFLAVAVIRYGLKGIILAVTGIFPQYLLYVPAMVVLLIWCENLNRSIYFRSGDWKTKEGGIFLPGRILQLLCILVIVILGCLMESFINPGIMAGLLKIF